MSTVGLHRKYQPQLELYEELATGRPDWLQLLTHPEIWAYDGTTMRETMEAFLDSDRAARLERLRADRIDLS